MLEQIIEKYLFLLLKRNIISKDLWEEYKYHLTCLVESFFVIAAMTLIAISCGVFFEVCIFMVFFFSVRNRAGGFHFNQFWKCFIGTIFLECMLILFIDHYAVNHVAEVDFMTFLSLFVLLMIGAVNHPNMNYSREEYLSAKKSSRSMVLIEFCIIFFLKSINASDIVTSYMECALILSAVLLALAIVTKQHGTAFSAP